MATSILIGENSNSTDFNDSVRQGVEITRPEFMRGINFPKILSNANQGLVRSGSLVANFDVTFFDETLTVPMASSVSSLGFEENRVYTVIRHQIEQRDLGQLDNSVDIMRAGREPFREADRFTAQGFIESGHEYFPLSSLDRNVYFDNPYRADGTIEPLTIRAMATFSGVEQGRESHGVFGSLQSSCAEDIFGNANLIVSAYNSVYNSAEPFFDAGPSNPILNQGTFPEPGYIQATGNICTPFKDQIDASSVASYYNDQEVSSLLEANLPSSFDFFPKDDIIVMTAGFSASPTQIKKNRLQGSDSIAFIGLRR
jgi:hypothetical protein